MPYVVRYHHTANDYADTLAEAVALARDELRRVRSRTAADAMVIDTSAPDGTYCYADQAAADADTTGTAAFAVIENEDRNA